MKWSQNTPLDFYDESVRIAYKSSNSSYIKGKIREKIRRCSGTVCFLGRTTFQSQWVNWELEESILSGNMLLLMGLPGGPTELRLPPTVAGRAWYIWNPSILAEFAK